jgi:hypothetical protein
VASPIQSTNKPAGPHRFKPGNAGGPGNPHAGKVQQLRAALYECTTREDMIAVWTQLKNLALGGDLAAIKEFLDRTVGKATIPVELQLSAGGVEVLSDAELEAIVLSSRVVDGGELAERKPGELPAAAVGSGDDVLAPGRK